MTKEQAYRLGMILGSLAKEYDIVITAESPDFDIREIADEYDKGTLLTGSDTGWAFGSNHKPEQLDMWSES